MLVASSSNRIFYQNKQFNLRSVSLALLVLFEKCVTEIDTFNIQEGQQNRAKILIRREVHPKYFQAFKITVRGRNCKAIKLLKDQKNETLFVWG